MDPDPSPRLRRMRCAALCRPQARAEHQLDQAPDARVARARATDVRVPPAARARVARINSPSAHPRRRAGAPASVRACTSVGADEAKFWQATSPAAGVVAG